MNKVKLVLVKISGCPYCIKFMPVFDKVTQLMKEASDFKDTELEIKIYDYNNEKSKFVNENKHLSFWAKGAPSIFLDCTINGKSELFDTIDPIYPVQNNEEENKKTAENFLKTIINSYLSLKSSQKGGKKDIFYKNKYLKYKNKYLILKNNN